MARSLLAPLLLSALAPLAWGGCASGLNVSMVKAAQRRPSNLAVFFTVKTRRGEPVAQLESKQFRIYEDGALVSLYESRQTILNPEVAAEHYTLLLVDMSGSVSESPQVPMLVEAATRFTESVGQYQRVAVYAFDGGAEIHPIVPFTTSPGASARGVSALARFRPRDPSTNLNGAIVRGLGVLDHAVAQARTPLRFGTLVVFTDGTDRAGRVEFSEVQKLLDEREPEVLAIGVGTEIDERTLSRIGRDGHWLVKDSAAVQQAFQTAADRIVGYTRSHYLLSYCSPARAGKHQVTIEAVAPDTGKSGRLTYEFDAAGFGPGCDPNTAPPFELKAQGATRAAPRAKAGGGAARPAAPAVAKSPATPAGPAANPEQGDY
jgi:hypothetical protein